MDEERVQDEQDRLPMFLGQARRFEVSQSTRRRKRQSVLTMS